MRKYAILKKPIKCNDTEYIYKIMLHEDHEDVYLYQYCSMDAVRCTYDAWYPDVETVYDQWNDEIDERGWIDLGDPLPDCQHDAFLPVRVKGRNVGKPQWGSFEILVRGKWQSYEP